MNHTIESFADMLNGGEYGNEISKKQKEEAKQQGLVVVIGASDDLVEFYGAIDDEAGAYDGTTVYVSKAGLFDSCDCDCEHSKAAMKKCKTIKAVWHNEGNPCWTFETDIPHATFDINEDDEVFCRGIVFNINDLEDHQ